ncbi:MAG TPA: hypothetical protein VMT35_04820, partial [Ignavibacteriaceae bacterium]|nr:hypothetical protein [Ignavibacteriaceae bacterium]
IKLALFQPIIFYTHPGEKRFHIFDSVFKKINSLGISSYSLKEYAEWWRKRSRITFSASVDDRKINIKCSIENESVWFKITYPNEEVFLSNLPGDINLNKKMIRNRDIKINFAENYSELRKTTARMIWHDILHRYRKYKI